MINGPYLLTKDIFVEYEGVFIWFMYHICVIIELIRRVSSIVELRILKVNNTDYEFDKSWL